MQPNCVRLAAFLRDVLRLKIPPEFPPELGSIPEARQLHDEMLELRRFILDVAAGELGTNLHLKGYVAGVLKTLQANLRHMTWQTQMIASGDFTQRLDFLGDFSKAFNAMTARLEASITTITENEAELSRINAGLRREIEAREQAQAALALREAHYRNLTETMKDVVWILDTATLRFLYISPSVQALRGFTPEEIMARPMDASLTPESAVAVRGQIEHNRNEFLAGRIAPGTFFTAEIEQPRKDGSTVWTEAIVRYVRNVQTGAVEIHGVTRDISLRLELERQATQDGLTGLFNRRHFLACAEHEIRRHQRTERPLAFLMLDIDHFKLVNDRHGHPTGDRALQAVAEACVETVRGADRVGRLGGEEFALLLPETPLNEARLVAERVRRRVADITLLTNNGQPVPLRVSIGVSLLRLPTDTIDALILRADQALYRAKHLGRDRVESEI